MKLKFTTLVVLLTLMCQGFLIHVNAQETDIMSKLVTGSYDSDWVLYQENDLVSIYSKYSDCSDPANGYYFEYLLFKIENKTNEQVLVNWYWDYTYNNIPRPNESDDEVDVYYYLSPQEVKEATCQSGENDRLRLFIRDKKNERLPKLTSFTINDFKATKN